MSDDAARRRRRRATSAQGAPSVEQAPTDRAPLAPAPAEPEPRRRGPDAASGTDPQPRAKSRPRPHRDNPERGLRDLIGAGRSQLGVSGALRGRDVNRPTEADLAEAEESVVIVRRHWHPTDQ